MNQLEDGTTLSKGVNAFTADDVTALIQKAFWSEDFGVLPDVRVHVCTADQLDYLTIVQKI